MSKIAVAISGGVDSSVAAYLLKSAGHEVVCIHMLLCPGSGEADSARAVAERLGLEFRLLDATREFDEKVMKYFAGSYMRGETPNPCVVCNKHIKFGVLYNYARSLGCEYLATGHYAATDGVCIKKSQVVEKDQSYYLWQLGSDVIPHIMFPLGDMHKSRVREVASEAGLITAQKKDSQDVCFIPDGDYRSFLRTYLKTDFEKGIFTDRSGKKLGIHEGFQCYTVGQRKGLGVSADRPLYVISKDASKNEVVLGDDADLMQTVVHLDEVKLHLPLGERFRANVKIRFRAKEAPAEVYVENDKATVTFDEPQRAPAPGQSAVFYVGDRVVGGGTIREGSASRK